MSLHLRSVRIPVVLRGFDDGGLGPEQAWDVRVEGDQLASVLPVAGPPEGTLVSAWVDAHVHLDKTDTVAQVGGAEGDLFAAIARMDAHRRNWTGPDLHDRMHRAIDEAWRSGTRALRTHLDWVEPGQTPVALEVFEQLRRDWRGRVALQFASLTPLDRFDAPGALAHTARTVQAAQGVLGAFVYRNADLGAKLRRLMAAAAEHALHLDLHIDEGLHLDAVGLQTAADLVQAFGLTGRVLCSHACSLSVQPPRQAEATLAACARAGIHLVALPSTNLYLQGAWDGTPVERGVTRLREARALGVSTGIATDNVADGFFPYGSYDLLDTFALGVQVAHLAPVGAWLDAITTLPARALGLPWDGRLQPGCPADLVVLAARNDHELVTPRGRVRTVIRGGRAL